MGLEGGGGSADFIFMGARIFLKNRNVFGTLSSLAADAPNGVQRYAVMRVSRSVPIVSRP